MSQTSSIGAGPCTCGGTGRSTTSVWFVSDWIEELRRFLARVRVRRHQRQALLELDDRMLRDIGLSRRDAATEAAKRFWQE